MENETRCEYAVKRLTAVVDGNAYMVDGCLTVWDDLDEGTKDLIRNEDPDAPETATLWDYLEDDVLETYYILDNNREYHHGRLILTCGGPTVWADTETGMVHLTHGLDKASACLPAYVVEALDEFIGEVYRNN